MPTRRNLLVGLAALPFFTTAARATPVVDIDLVTGFDLSSSMRNHARPHLQALVDALTRPAFLQQLTCGPQGCARIELYGWSSSLRPLLGPHLIRRSHMQADMANFLAPLHQALQAQPVVTGFNPFESLGRAGKTLVMPPGLPNIIANGGSTDTALAMNAGIRLLSHRHAGRKVLNIVTDDDPSRQTGETEAMGAHQAQAQASGITINGLVIGDATAMDHYFHKFVRTPDGFVLSTADIPKVPEIWERKFSQDLIG